MIPLALIVLHILRHCPVGAGGSGKEKWRAPNGISGDRHDCMIDRTNRSASFGARSAVRTTRTPAA